MKVPCDCPKGGMSITSDGEDYTVCPKCNGTEWVEAPTQDKENKE